MILVLFAWIWKEIYQVITIKIFFHLFLLVGG